MDETVDLMCGRLTAITQLVHHGMVFVPIGYTFGAGMFEMEEVKGGSPYGSGTYVGGDGIIMWSCCHAWKCDRLVTNTLYAAINLLS